MTESMPCPVPHAQLEREPRVKAMLLAAGHGTRLRPLTDRVPKALVPVGGMPVIEHNLRPVARHGAEEGIIKLHAHPDAIPAYFGDGARRGLHGTYLDEEHLL